MKIQNPFNRKLLNRIPYHFFGMVRVVLTPDCWFRIHSYSKEWNKICIGFLEDKNVSITDITSYRATINGYRVWIENHPYGSFHLCDCPKEISDLLPSRITSLRLMDMIDKHLDTPRTKEDMFKRYLEDRSWSILKGKK